MNTINLKQLEVWFVAGRTEAAIKRLRPTDAAVAPDWKSIVRVAWVFLLFPVSMLLLTVAFLVSRQTRMDLFTFLTALVAAAPWIVYFAVPYVENVAIPEMISALAASTWTMVMAIRILKQPS